MKTCRRVGPTISTMTSSLSRLQVKQFRIAKSRWSPKTSRLSSHDSSSYSNRASRVDKAIDRRRPQELHRPVAKRRRDRRQVGPDRRVKRWEFAWMLKSTLHNSNISQTVTDWGETAARRTIRRRSSRQLFQLTAAQEVRLTGWTEFTHIAKGEWHRWHNDARQADDENRRSGWAWSTNARCEKGHGLFDAIIGVLKLVWWKSLAQKDTIYNLNLSNFDAKRVNIRESLYGFALIRLLLLSINTSTIFICWWNEEISCINGKIRWAKKRKKLSKIPF